jgi:hypothetical protein
MEESKEEISPNSKEHYLRQLTGTMNFISEQFPYQDEEIKPEDNPILFVLTEA